MAGGGTGGHTSPGLAVAAVLRRRGLSCAWIGSRDGVEARRVPAAGLPYHAIATGKLRRYWAWRNLTDLAVNVPAGVFQARRLLRGMRPRVVFGTGGFVALPVVAAAASLRIPVVIHEQTAMPGLANRLAARAAHRIALAWDVAAAHFPRGRVVVAAAASLRIPVVIHEQTAVPGLANRLAARAARRIALAWDVAAAHFPRGRVVVTGNPVRAELRDGSRADAIARFGLDPSLPLVYLTGGAQGAHRINRIVGEAIERLLPHAQVVHQCGDNPETGDRRWLEGRRAALPPPLAARYHVVPYLHAELAGVYAAASLVIGRAGAGTVNECCQLGVPALYVPLPGTSGDEQTANARLVERAGGCVVLPQSELTAASLVDRVVGLLRDPARLKEMGERARALAVPDAAERLADVIAEVVGRAARGTS